MKAMYIFAQMLLMTELTLCSFNVTGVKRDASMYYVHKLLSEEKIDLCKDYITIYVRIICI